MGDVLVATPVLTALRRRFPEARIDALVHRPWERILAGNPDVDGVLSYDRQGPERGLRARLDLLRRLRRQPYDWVLSIHAASSVALALVLSRARWRTCVWRYGTRKPPHWWRGFHQHVRQDRSAGARHEVEHNLDVLRELGIAPDHQGIRVVVPAEAEALVARLLRDRGRRPELPLALLHAGHGGGRQCWPPEHYAELARMLAGAGMDVGLTGGPGEIQLTAGISRAAGVPVLDLAGSTPLEHLPALLRQAAVLLSVPTGPMHMAAGLSVPVVALYGPTDLAIDLTRFAPYGTACRQISSPLPCPCPGSRQCTEALCLRAITPAMVGPAMLDLARPAARGENRS